MQRFLLSLSLFVPLACGGDVVGAKPPLPGSPLYWALVLDQHAITLDTLSPYDTVRLTATPRTVSGAPLDGLSAVTYSSADLERVRVSADGLVQALKPGTGVPVVATLTVGEFTHADTVVVNVTADPAPPRIMTFSIHPIPPDSARWDANKLDDVYSLGAKQLTVRALDGAQQAMSGLAVDYRSSDSSIAAIDRTTGVLRGRHPGQVTLVASATAFGVMKADTLPFTITAPLSAGIDVQHPFLGASNGVFIPTDVTIEAGGVVSWSIFANFQGAHSLQVDVVFDDPTQVKIDQAVCVPFLQAVLGAICDAGDIPAFGDTTSDGTLNYLLNIRTRQFPVPGTYPFHSPLTHAAGTIHVVQTPEASPRVARSHDP